MYFSEREMGGIPRHDEAIPEGAWGGIRALIRGRIDDGSLGATYPLTCEDGLGTIGTNEMGFLQALRAEVPSLSDGMRFEVYEETPETVDVLDVIEFCWRCVGLPVQDGYHGFFDHYHLQFDIDDGRHQFRECVNRIFRRNRLAYELTATGRINRLAPRVLRETLADAQFNTGDAELDTMLQTARHKFIDPSETTRREALQTLWDAWERLKTLSPGRNKSAQAESLLDSTAESSSSKFRSALEREAKELNWIGNNLQIRHSEINQERVIRSQHVDYLFHRLFALIDMIIRMQSRI